MIFKMFMIYRKAKKGTIDPKEFVADEVGDAIFGVATIPGIILLAVTILLGILSFTHWIAAPSTVAQIFFWIFAVVLGAYFSFIFIMKKLFNRVMKKAMDKNYEN